MAQLRLMQLIMRVGVLLAPEQGQRAWCHQLVPKRQLEAPAPQCGDAARRTESAVHRVEAARRRSTCASAWVLSLLAKRPKRNLQFARDMDHSSVRQGLRLLLCRHQFRGRCRRRIKPLARQGRQSVWGRQITQDARFGRRGATPSALMRRGGRRYSAEAPQCRCPVCRKWTREI